MGNEQQGATNRRLYALQEPRKQEGKESTDVRRS
jgi:hypothetical protein